MNDILENSSRFLTEQQINKLFTHFDNFLSPIIKSGKKIIFIDFVHSGASLLATRNHLEQFFIENQYKVESEFIGLAYNKNIKKIKAKYNIYGTTINKIIPLDDYPVLGDLIFNQGSLAKIAEYQGFDITKNRFPKKNNKYLKLKKTFDKYFDNYTITNCSKYLSRIF